jgi:tetratricopeptide (TPR) repeat protein|tara:strand:+ start:344 stop:832 length:489 start_codon:yes stop_codon:yes gene_type:complete
MKRLFLIVFCIFFSFNKVAHSAGSSGGDASSKSNYDRAVNLIKSAKNYEKKNKIEKANKRYEKALKLLIKENKKKPNQPNTLNYLGFTTRKLGDYENGEKYYLQGLQIDPNHKGINEYLGELYVVTNRINLAKERLDVLKNCNCEEYAELKEIIDGKKKSKY